MVSFFVELKSVQTSSTMDTKMYETSASINLRPPPFDRNKSFDEEDLSRKPVVPKKVHIAPVNAVSYSIADLQMATDSFSTETLIGEGSIGRVYRAQFDDGKVFFEVQSLVFLSTLLNSICFLISSFFFSLSLLAILRFLL